jgi:hypothetical protein
MSMVAPADAVGYAIAPITFFPDQCFESVVSSYAIAVTRNAALDRKRARPPSADRPRHTAQPSQRRRSAVARRIRPAGMGRQGLLSLSSATLRYWFEKLNVMRCSHVHATASATLKDDDAGAVIVAKTVCNRA